MRLQVDEVMCVGEDEEAQGVAIGDATQEEMEKHREANEGGGEEGGDGEGEGDGKEDEKGRPAKEKDGDGEDGAAKKLGKEQGMMGGLMRPLDNKKDGGDDEDGQAVIQEQEMEGGGETSGPGCEGEAEAQAAIQNPISAGQVRGDGENNDFSRDATMDVDEGAGLEPVPAPLVVREKGVGAEEGRKLWESCAEATRGMAGHLTESLRLVLLPTLRAKLQVRCQPPDNPHHLYAHLCFPPLSCVACGHASLSRTHVWRCAPPSAG